MADFKYRAIDKSGHIVEGTMSADAEVELDSLLLDLGYWLVSSSLIVSDKRLKNIKVSRKELIDFCSAMAAMLTAGISLVDAFRTMTVQSSNAGFLHVMEDIAINVEAGNTVYDSMSKYPDVFPDQMRNLVKAGEFSGHLSDAFSDLQSHLEWTDKLMSEIKQVSIYPTIVFIAVILFVLLLFTFVVPKFAAILVDLDVPLPAITQAVMSIGDFTKNYWWLIIGVPVSCVFAIKIAIKRSYSFALAFDSFKLKIPIFGEISQMIALSRFAHNMAVLMRAGVPILQALNLCHGTVGNRVVAEAIRGAELAVNEGKTLSSVFKEHKIFPPMMLKMIMVGEETGGFDRALNHVSSRYDAEIPARVKRIFSILEPAIMMLLICIVGTVAMAIFLPLMSLMSGIG